MFEAISGIGGGILKLLLICFFISMIIEVGTGIYKQLRTSPLKLLSIIIVTLAPYLAALVVGYGLCYKVLALPNWVNFIVGIITWGWFVEYLKRFDHE